MAVAKTILVTGGRGFIGRNVVEGLSGIYHVLAPGHEELDLLDEAKVRSFFEEQQIAVVIHCAGHDHSRNSKKDRSLVVRNNLYMFFIINII